MMCFKGKNKEILPVAGHVLPNLIEYNPDSEPIFPKWDCFFAFTFSNILKYITL